MKTTDVLVIGSSAAGLVTGITAQIGTPPLLTASPAGYPLIKAAEAAAAKIMLNHEN
jgi:thioredoxin reductase